MSSKNFLLNEVREAWNTNSTNYTANFGLYSVQVCKTGGLLGKILDILGWNTRHVTITVDKSLDKRDVQATSDSPSVTFKCDDFSDFNEKIGKAREKIREKNFGKILNEVRNFKQYENENLPAAIYAALDKPIFRVLVPEENEGKEAKELDALEVLEEYCKLAKSSPKRRRTEVEDRILQDVKRYLET
ncbi:MAG: hypothetical protein LBI81_02915, partial [Puniceicoccales bacterium]|nr:hypothetical protein [Puniceicoccales bacterium]